MFIELPLCPIFSTGQIFTLMSVSGYQRKFQPPFNNVRYQGQRYAHVADEPLQQATDQVTGHIASKLFSN